MNKKIIIGSIGSIVFLSVVVWFLGNGDEVKQEEVKVQVAQEMGTQTFSENVENEMINEISKKSETGEDEQKNSDVSLDENTIKTIYSVTTRDRHYELALVSELDISSKPKQKKYDSGVIINENFILFGTIDNNSSYRMLFGKDVIENANNITFIVKNNVSGEKEEIMPSFLYAMEKNGEYKMDIQMSPLVLSNIEYVAKKNDFRKILEKIQLGEKEGLRLN